MLIQNETTCYPIASVKTDVDSSLEENEVALGELERLELRPQVVPVVRQEVLEQVGVHGASAKRAKMSKTHVQRRRLHATLTCQHCQLSKHWQAQGRRSVYP